MEKEPSEWDEDPDAEERARQAHLETANPILALVRRYYNDPVGLVRFVLKAEPLPWQCIFLEQIAKGERRISIRAGHGVGKSTAMAWALIWHALTRFPQKSVCTAPTAAQLYDALFAELKKWVNALPEEIRPLFFMTTDRITLVAAPEASFISARTASVERPEALSGVHSDFVLLVADEAPGIPEQVYENAFGSTSGKDACVVLIGNPTRNSGLFYKTHHALKRDPADYDKPGADGWWTMHVSCLDNPLVDRDYIKQIRDTYGEESNAYRVRVLGEFPLQEDDVLIAQESVEAAMNRDITPSPSEPLVYGVDVARFGNDRSCLLKRRGNVVPDFKTFRGLDLMALVGVIVNEAKQDHAAGANLQEILVDSIGLGSGVADRLREIQPTTPELKGVSIRDVNVAETNAMNPSANRLRDELWLAVRDWLRGRVCKLPLSDDLRSELCTPTYSFTSMGKIMVESKDSLKRRGMKSPDVADALCLTFASTATTVGGRGTSWASGEPLTRVIKGIV